MALGLAIVPMCTVSAAVAGGPAESPAVRDTALSAAQRDTLQGVRALIRLGQYDAAERRAYGLLAAVERDDGRQSLQTARTLDVLVESLRRNGRSCDSSARALAQRAVAIKEQLLGPDDPELAQSLLGLGNMLRSSGDAKSAQPPLERALAIREKALGPEHPDVAIALTALANVHTDRGDYAGSEPLYERALKIQQSAPGPDSTERAGTLAGLAIVLREKTDYKAAQPLFERALNIRETALGPAHPDVASSLTGLAGVLRLIGDSDAWKLYRRALAIQEQSLRPDHPDLARTLNSLAIMYRDAGLYEDARPLFERALAIQERSLGPEHPELAGTINNLANLHSFEGDHAAARRLHERALAIREKALGPNHPQVAASLMGLGIALDGLGEPAEARGYYERALAIYEQKFGPDHPSVAWALNSLAGSEWSAGEPAKAKPLFERALAIHEKAYGPDHPMVAWNLTNLGNVLRAMGDYAAAKTFLERALATYEKVLDPDHTDIAMSLDGLADLLCDMGDFAGARPLLERALASREKISGPEHPDVAQNLLALARVLYAEGDSAAAADSALEAETLGREHFRAIARVLPEREALASAAIRPAGLSLALSELHPGSSPERVREAIDAQVRARALVLDEMAARHRFLESTRDTEVTRLQSDFRAAVTRYAALLARGPEADHLGRYRAELDSARAERDRYERVLSERSAEFRRDRLESRIGLDQVQARLGPGSALVGYVSYLRLTAGSRTPGVPSYLAYVLTSGSDRVEVVSLGAAREVDSLVARWSEQVAGGSAVPPGDLGVAAYRRAGAALRASIWDPVWPALRDAKRVFVVPDGALSLVNLDTLPLDDGTYLIENGPLLQTLSAERDLVTLDSAGTPGRGLLALGGPDFDASPAALAKPGRRVGGGSHAVDRPQSDAGYRGARSGCADFATMRFDPLPGTVSELDDVGQVWKRKRARSSPPRTASGSDAGFAIELRGAAATERAFKQLARGRAVLHLATHGFFVSGRCRSALDVGAGSEGRSDRRAEPDEAHAGENPLLLSGLALAGANHRDETKPGAEDGILTADEVAAMDLGGVQWAVLSACETGVGDVRAGEGVFGLRRAFQVAGARTLIMSLWSVDDEATREWMRSLYEARFQRALGTAEAVREASLATLRSRRARGRSPHPYYWGAFVATGDWK